MSFKIEFYGVRGSYAISGPQFQQYGGATTCVSIVKTIDDIDHRIIIDAGTGIIALGKKLITDIKESLSPVHLHLFLTHYHMDHIRGLSIFAPLHHPNCVVHIYGMEFDGLDVQSVLETFICKATFPVCYHQMNAKKRHYTIHNHSKIPIGPFTIDVMRSDKKAHPQTGCLHYRITDNDSQKSISCVWDHEASEKGNESVISFIKDTDILIHDTQYTTAKYCSQDKLVKGFGHSTYAMAIKAAKKAGVKKTLICFHYDPENTDDELNEIKKTRSTGQSFDIHLPTEGSVFTV